MKHRNSILLWYLVTHCQTVFNRKTVCDCNAEIMAFNAEKFFSARHSCNQTSINTYCTQLLISWHVIQLWHVWDSSITRNKDVKETLLSFVLPLSLTFWSLSHYSQFTVNSFLPTRPWVNWSPGQLISKSRCCPRPLVPVPVLVEAKLSFVEPGRRWAHSPSPVKPLVFLTRVLWKPPWRC